MTLTGPQYLSNSFLRRNRTEQKQPLELGLSFGRIYLILRLKANEIFFHSYTPLFAGIQM
jgi:hypothetical protein